MLKYVKNLICITLSIFIFIFSSTMPITAAYSDNGYIIFTNPNSRIDSDGSFIFEVYMMLTSDKFIADSDTLTLVTQAQVEYQGLGNTGPYNDENISFKVTLYKKNLIGSSVVGSYVGYADNIRGGITYNVEQGKTYYFTISVISDISLPMYVVGSGEVFPISLPE